MTVSIVAGPTGPVIGGVGEGNPAEIHRSTLVVILLMTARRPEKQRCKEKKIHKDR